MTAFLSWYLLLTLLGWLTFPLAWRLFPALADRGFSLARALGLLLWGYLFWMLTSLGVTRNDGGGLLLTFLLVAGAGAAALWGGGRSTVNEWASMLAWLKANRRLLIAIESLFFLAFATWAFVRACNPNIETAGGEKTMELAFINSILRSPTFPPRDPWLSGYAISYYYFGYVMTAMLAKATATPGAVAHNLMLALVFALSAVGAYGILYNLLSARRNRSSSLLPSHSSLLSPLLGPLFLLFVSNAAGFLEVLHRRGIFWSGQPGDSNLWTVLGRLVRPNLQAYNFWTWLDINHLNIPPLQPPAWVPDRYIWWWQDSRVIQDYDLAGNFREIIDEFPAFSYLLGDLHPHVLAMPFGLLVIAAALNLFLGGWKGSLDLRFVRLPLAPLHLFAGALLLGGMAFLNTWDILFGFALITAAYVLSRALASGWTWERLTDLLLFSLPLGLLAILLYLPFYLGFSSQAGGILPNLDSPTRGAHLWVMFGPLFLPLFAWLIFLRRGERVPARWNTAFSLGLGLTFFLWGFSWLLGMLAKFKMPDFAAMYLQTQGFPGLALFFGAATLRRLAFLPGLLTLLALLIPAIAFLAHPRPIPKDETQQEVSPSASPANFSLLLLLLGALLVLAPEFVFLRDLFGNRMNTIFKFYFQAWQLWSLAAAFGATVMLQELRRAWKWAYSLALALMLLVGLAFPVFALPNKTANFQIPAFRQLLAAARAAGDSAPLRTAASVWTLDGAQLFHRQYPDDAAAADWLATAPDGVIAEAVGGQYSDYARMSAYSGLPAVVGWIGHEDQWRGTFDEQRQRGERDIPRLYQTNNWDEARAIIEKYNIRYLVVGTLERRTYRLNELNFQHNLVEVFRSGDVVIYQVP